MNQSLESLPIRSNVPSAYNLPVKSVAYTANVCSPVLSCFLASPSTTLVKNLPVPPNSVNVSNSVLSINVGNSVSKIKI